MAWRMPITKFIFPRCCINRIKDGVAEGGREYDTILEQSRTRWN